MRGLFQLRATGLELGDIGRRGQGGLALGQQEVAGVSGTHGDAITQVAQVRYLLEKNDVHGLSLNAGQCRAATPGSVRA